MRFLLDDITRWKLTHLARALVLYGIPIALYIGSPVIEALIPGWGDTFFWMRLCGLGLVAWQEPHIESRRRRSWLKHNAYSFATSLKSAIKSLIEESPMTLGFPSELLNDAICNPDPAIRKRAAKDIITSLEIYNKKFKPENRLRGIARKFIDTAGKEGERPDHLIRPIDYPGIAESGLFDLYPRLGRWIACYNEMLGEIRTLIPQAEAEIVYGDTTGTRMLDLGIALNSTGRCGLHIARIYTSILVDASSSETLSDSAL
jgi:hypothetical protein